MGCQVQQAWQVQGDSVQEICRVQAGPGKEEVRPKAARLWRSVQAYSEEEGKDHQEVGAQDGVLCLQVEEPGAHQEDQTLRAGRREEEEGTDDPVLTLYPSCPCPSVKAQSHHL